MARLSVCMIVKNEEAMLEKCLSSVEGADEIVICDTGSSDSTVAISERIADSVVKFDWIDDFSAARNYVKSFATNEWILSIDADEEIVSERGIERIKALLDTLSEEVDVINVTMDNGHGTKNWLGRVFRKRCDWKGAIHETIEHKKAMNCDIVIRYGRSPAHDLDPFLDMRILRKEYEKDPENTRITFYLARECFYMGQYASSIVLLDEYLSKSYYLSEITYAHYLKAKCHWHSNQGNLARESCVRAISMNPNFKSALRLMSEMTYEPSKSRWASFAEIADDTNCLFTS